MRFALYSGYLLTAALTVLQAVLLRKVMRRVMWLLQLGIKDESVEPDDSARPLPVGSQIPGFKAQVLGTDRLIASSDIVGRRAALIFVSPTDAELASVRDGSLRFSLDLLAERLAGAVYVICSGTREECLRFSTKSLLADTIFPSSVVMLEDSYGWLRRAFALDRSPVAARIDEYGRIERYGYPLELVIDEIPASVVQQLRTEAGFAATSNNGVVVAAQEGEGCDRTPETMAR